MNIPTWALALAFWLHMLATVTWIGGLATLAIFVLPAARKTLETTSYSAFINQIQRILDPIAWFSLVTLAVTGMFQLSSNPNYQGFLAVNSTWAVAILVKHLVFLTMAGVSAYLTWVLLPKLSRIALRQVAEKDLTQSASLINEARRLQSRDARLVQINLFLGVVVLALTAIARAI